MAVKKCCIDNCKSCSTRKEDKGVTYHKFPKDVILCDIWMSASRKRNTHTDMIMYVCSRHFCKSDFQIYKDSKYILKSDAVPSIFPWSTEDSDTDMESIKSADDTNNASPTFKELDIESVDAIKKFIEQQEKEIQELKAGDTPTFEKNNDDSMDSKVSQSETISVASSVIDMIISESEMEIARKRDLKSKTISPDKANGSMALSVGSKVEAKDFADDWYSAEIIEVDYDEMEVLVHYDVETKKHDEWISVSSPRLRPVGSCTTVKPSSSSVESWSSDTNLSNAANSKEESKEPKTEEKVHPTFEIGERCLARWRDNRRFVATIRNILPNGSYEIIFDDGCQWTCKVSRLYKLKPGDAPNTPATVYPQYGAGPSNVDPQASPVYHTHLFDPTRDYLGSKSERREMKRKLNIKEIFNIGQKRPKTQKTITEKAQKTPVERKPRIIRKKGLKLKRGIKVEAEVKTEIPAADAVASIIGTVEQQMPPLIKQEEPSSSEFEDKEKPENMEVESNDVPLAELDEETQSTDLASATEMVDESDKVELEDLKPYLDPEVLEEEVKLEQFEKPDEGTHEEVIDRIKEAINKLEDGLYQAEMSSPKPEIKLKLEIPKTELVEPKTEVVEPKTELVELKIEEKPVIEEKVSEKEDKVEKGEKKVKKKKLRILREKNVKQQVEKVKTELAQMKKRVNEMRKQMLHKEGEMSETFLLPGEWCCRWVNGQPVGTVSEIECDAKPDATGKPPLPRRSVQVTDKRLPEGWTKHMVRRSFGHSAGKWDVVLVSPDNHRFHTKNEMRVYLENHREKNLQPYEHALTDFGAHLKLARRMGWISHTPDGLTDGPTNQLAAGTLSSTSPLVKKKKLGLKRKGTKDKTKVPKLTIKLKPPEDALRSEEDASASTYVPIVDDNVAAAEPNLEQLNTPPLEDGYVFVGSLKVQIIDNLLRCPAEGCFKNFRNNTLIQMHIKHYHKELRKMMGATPKVLDLAYARTKPLETETPRAKDDQKIIKVKIPRPPKHKVEKEEPKIEMPTENIEAVQDTTPVTPVKEEPIPRSQDSPKLRQALINKPVKRPRVLLPVRRPDPEPPTLEPINEDIDFENQELIEPIVEIPPVDTLDFETAISTHTVTKPVVEKKRKGEKRKKSFVLLPKGQSEEEDWFATNSDIDTRSSYPRSGTPDSKVDSTSKVPPVSSESNEENKDAQYTYNENGERIKIVHMKREEIINCHCGFREEDGLMIQCELCLCWQHALCHNIQREADVPEKYTCSICQNPLRGRRSMRFVHSQERLYEGILPGGRPCPDLKTTYELSGNLMRIADALHALRVKYAVATKKDHPKLYLWAEDWENPDYSDLMMGSIGKENLPLKPEDVKIMSMDMRSPPSVDINENDGFSQRNVPLNLNGLLSSPDAESFDLPLDTNDLVNIAKSMRALQPVVKAPVPEAAIEDSVCRERLLQHIARCQADVETRLSTIDARITQLESLEQQFEDDDNADNYPRTTQTIQMLMRDLNTMEELGVIT